MCNVYNIEYIFIYYIFSNIFMSYAFYSSWVFFFDFLFWGPLVAIY